MSVGIIVLSASIILLTFGFESQNSMLSKLVGSWIFSKMLDYAEL
jgi:hypothetical protein